MIRTDANNNVRELDEDNNLVAIPLTILQSPLPDLTIKDISTEEILTSGQPMKVRTTIANIGKMLLEQTSGQILTICLKALS